VRCGEIGRDRREICGRYMGDIGQIYGRYGPRVDALLVAHVCDEPQVLGDS
jgi:hypothetical protein